MFLLLGNVPFPSEVQRPSVSQGNYPQVQLPLQDRTNEQVRRAPEEQQQDIKPVPKQRIIADKQIDKVSKIGIITVQAFHFLIIFPHCKSSHLE